MTREFDASASILWTDEDEARKPCTPDYFLYQAVLRGWAVIRGGEKSTGQPYFVFELRRTTRVKIFFDSAEGRRTELFTQVLRPRRRGVTLIFSQRCRLDSVKDTIRAFFENRSADASNLIRLLQTKLQTTITMGELWQWLSNHAAQGQGPESMLEESKLLTDTGTGRGSKLDPLRAEIIDRLTTQEFSLAQCRNWLVETQGITITRQALQQWATQQNIKRPAKAARIDLFTDEILGWFHADQKLTVNAAKSRLAAEHSVQVNTTHLSKWLKERGVTPFTPPSYVAALDEVWNELMAEVSNSQLSPREAAAWLAQRKNIRVPISAITQRIQKKGIRISYVFTRKRESILDPLKKELSELFADPAVKVPHGIKWLKETHGIHLIPLTLTNWLRNNQIRVPVSKPLNKGVSDKLRSNKDAILRKFRDESITVADGVKWVTNEFGFSVSAQTLSAFLHENECAPRRLRSQRPAQTPQRDAT